MFDKENNEYIVPQLYWDKTPQEGKDALTKCAKVRIVPDDLWNRFENEMREAVEELRSANRLSPSELEKSIKIRLDRLAGELR